MAESATGRLVGEPLTCDAFPKTPKWEGMSRDDRGNYYLVGAHTAKTEETLRLQAQMIRFRLKGTGTSGDPLAIDAGSVRRWKIRDSLAVGPGPRAGRRQEAQDRGPDRLHPPRRPRPSRAARTGRRPPQPGRPGPRLHRRHQPRPGPRRRPDLRAPLRVPRRPREGEAAQLTSLHYLPAWKGFFVVTATEDEENAFHGNTLWFLPLDEIPAGRGVAAPQRVYDFEVAMKAEGLTDLPAPAGSDPARSARLLVTFDNDAHATHIPSRMQTLRLTRGRDDDRCLMKSRSLGNGPPHGRRRQPSFQSRGTSAMGSRPASFSLSPMSGGMGRGPGPGRACPRPFLDRPLRGSVGAGRRHAADDGPAGMGVMPPNFGYPFRQPPSLAARRVLQGMGMSM